MYVPTGETVEINNEKKIKNYPLGNRLTDATDTVFITNPTVSSKTQVGIHINDTVITETFRRTTQKGHSADKKFLVTHRR